MDDLKLKDVEDSATEIINLQLRNIIAANDTESINSIPDDLDIPDITVLPSLDDILSQEDPINLLDDDLREDIDNVLLADDDLMSIISSSSFSSFSKNSAAITNNIKSKKKLYGEVVNCTNISLLGGMCSKDDKATALTTKNQVICIGLKSGKIFAMSINGETSNEINTNKISDAGAVTSLDITDGILAASYSTGSIHIWDLANNSYLQKIDSKIVGSTIIQVIVIDKTHLLYVVSQGSVFDVKLTKTLSIRGSESTCLFSGSHGEVLNIQKLSVSKEHPLHSFCLVALCTFKQIMLLSLNPYPNIKYSIRLWGDTSSLPILNWYYHTGDCEKPKLVIGRGNRFVVYNLNLNNRNQIFLRKLKPCSVEFQVISIFWLNTNTIGLLDRTEKLHLIDIHSLSRLQTITRVSDIGMCYNTAYFRSLATGGNVSKAMHAASQYAAYNSIISYPGGTWILGNHDVLKVTITPWRQRIVNLKKDMHFQDAIDLALQFYQGKGKGVSSLVFKKIDAVQSYCIDIILEIFAEYIEETQQDLLLFAYALKQCINACIIINKPSFVYDEIYTRLSQISTIQKTFYETLEPFIFNNKISSLNPVLMKDLLEYFKNNDQLQSFEKCILHLDPLNLDIHNTLLLCNEYDMYEAILFIYNACLFDFTSPLNKLLEILHNQLVNHDNTHKQVGYVILMYISNCLIGNLPASNISDPDEVQAIQNLVFNTVFCKHTDKTDEPDYPYVKLMLLLDTREFLNVMSVTFGHPMCLPIHQIVIDILLHVMIEEGADYMPLQIGHLFTFLARQKVVNSFYLDKKYLDQALDCLATNDVNGHEEREQALLELILTIGVGEFNEDRLLALSESAEFYQVCEVIYDKRHQYDKVLFCYWSDTSRIDKVFQYIYHIMEGKYSEVDKSKIRQTCIENIDKLVNINNEETSTLILKVFSEDIEKIVSMLHDQPKTLYSLLQCVYDISKVSDEPDIQNYEIHHKYIKLMSRYNPEFVCPYLKLAIGYNIDDILKLCLIANLKDAAAYLYEKRGDLEDAFTLYYDVLRDTINNKQMIFVEETLHKIITFCQRNSHQLSVTDKESYWFSLIDLLLGLGDAKDCMALQENLIDNMLGFVSSSKVLDKLIRNSSNKTFKTYGDIRKVVWNMLDTLMYEDVLLCSTKKIVQNDIFTDLRKDKTDFMRGFDVTRNLCVVCCQCVTPSGSCFFIFQCAHLVHTTCIEHQRFKHCVLCEPNQTIDKDTRQLLSRAISINEPYQQTHFESWRERLNKIRQVLDGSDRDRLALIHEICEDGYDDNNEDDFVTMDLSQFSEYFQNDNEMSNFMTSHSESYSSNYQKRNSNLTPAFSDNQNYQQSSKQQGLVHVHNSPRQSPKLTCNTNEKRSDNPFGEEPTAHETSNNPFGSDDTVTPTDSNNPFGDDTNPFADDYNPFADDI